MRTLYRATVKTAPRYDMPMYYYTTAFNIDEATKYVQTAAESDGLNVSSILIEPAMARYTAWRFKKDEGE